MCFTPLLALLQKFMIFHAKVIPVCQKALRSVFFWQAESYATK